MTTIAILGILIAIGVIIFLGLLERWRVEAATNQIMADMRLAYERATNQLTDWRVVVAFDRGVEDEGADYGGVRSVLWKANSDERGFTLPEVLITIVILGILFAIASSTWQSVVEGRQVDSATNQLASDLRLAHSKAANQLRSHQVVLTDGSSSYKFGPPGSLVTRTLPDEVKIDTSLTTIEFNPDGSITVLAGAVAPSDTTDEIVVSKTANPATDPKNGIRINPTTSRVEID